MRGLSICSYIVALFFMLTGLHRIYIYKNLEQNLADNVNVWVDGDAYNYIINGTHATTFMVTALLFVVVGLAIQFLIRFDNNPKP